MLERVGDGLIHWDILLQGAGYLMCLKKIKGNIMMRFRFFGQRGQHYLLNLPVIMK